MVTRIAIFDTIFHCNPNRMAGQSIIIVGTNGTGKTTYIKERLKNVNKSSLLLYDVNNEYGKIYDQPFVKMEEFLGQATKVNNHVIVFEEATIFFSNRSTDKEMRELLVRRRHTKNMLFLVFHSIRSVPRDIMDMSNYLVLKYTNDSPKFIERKFENEAIDEAVLKLKSTNKSGDPFHTILVPLK